MTTSHRSYANSKDNYAEEVKEMKTPQIREEVYKKTNTMRKNSVVTQNLLNSDIRELSDHELGSSTEHH